MIEYGSGDSALIILFALITVATPAWATYTEQSFRSCVRLAALRAIRRRCVGGAFTCPPLSEPPAQRLLVLFTAIGVLIFDWVLYTRRLRDCQMSARRGSNSKYDEVSQR